MTEIRFYHLHTKPLEQALPEILAKAVARGMRVVVKLGSAARVEVMDTALWTYDPSSFLPHGRHRDGQEAEHPVWLTTEDDNPNAATVLMLADGAVSDTVADYALVCEVFDGHDVDSVASARTRWTDYRAAGHDVSYFQQTPQGGWEQKA